MSERQQSLVKFLARYARHVRYDVLSTLTDLSRNNKTKKHKTNKGDRVFVNPVRRTYVWGIPIQEGISL
jgi:hypothetical protein